VRRGATELRGLLVHDRIVVERCTVVGSSRSR
jgi:hypothetical protein